MRVVFLVGCCCLALGTACVSAPRVPTLTPVEPVSRIAPPVASARPPVATSAPAEVARPVASAVASAHPPATGATETPAPGIPAVWRQAAPIAVDSATDRIYVTDRDPNQLSGALRVLDGSTLGGLATIAPPPTYHLSWGSPRVEDGDLNSAATVAVEMPDSVFQPLSVAVNEVTDRVYVTTENSVVAIDGATNAVLGSIRLPPDSWVRALAVNPRTNRIYALSGSTSREMAVIDGRTTKIIADISLPLGGGGALAVNPSTNRVYVAGSCRNPGTNGCIGQDTIAVIDGNTNAVMATLHFDGDPVALALNPTSNRVYVALQREVVMLDGATNRTVASAPLSHMDALAVNSRTSQVFAVGRDADSLFILDGTSGQVVGTIPLDCWPGHVEVNPAAGRVYVSTDRFVGIHGAGGTGLILLDGIAPSARGWSGSCRDIEGRQCRCDRNPPPTSSLTPTTTPGSSS